MLADYHVHTSYSDDSTYPLQDVCTDAVRLGFDAIAITDHVDYGVKPDADEYRAGAPARLEDGKPVINVDYPRYFEELATVRERFEGHLSIARGLELGVQQCTLDRFSSLVERWEDQLDFAILSIHQVDNQEFWTGDFQRGRTQDAYNMAYYEEMLAVVQSFDAWSVLGHLDLIRRYDPAGPYPFEKIRDVVAEILRCAIAGGHGIEVNTSSFRYGLDDLQPSTEILELYRDLGGRILTIGSDSHKPEHLGAHITDVRDRLRALGYTEVCTFTEREPVFHAL